MSIIWGKVISDIYFWNRRRKQELSVLFIVEKELAIIRENQGMELHQDLCYQQKSKVGQKQEVAATIRLLPVFILYRKFLWISYITKCSAGCARCAKEGCLQQPHIGAAKRSKVCISFRSVLSGHLQDVQHPSRIEEYREFKADLSALFFSM